MFLRCFCLSRPQLDVAPSKAGTVALPFVLEQWPPGVLCIDADALRPQFIDDDRQLLFFLLRKLWLGEHGERGKKN